MSDSDEEEHTKLRNTRLKSTSSLEIFKFIPLEKNKKHEHEALEKNKKSEHEEEEGKEIFFLHIWLSTKDDEPTLKNKIKIKKKEFDSKKDSSEKGTSKKCIFIFPFNKQFYWKNNY